MDCTEFLARYSDYLDGLALGEAARFEAHLRVCRACARYDRVVRQALRLCRELPPIRPSEDFLPRLQHKIYHLEEELRRRPAFAGHTALAVVLILGFVTAAWLPALLHRHEVVLPPIVVEAPARPEVRGPFALRPLWLGVEEPSIFWAARRPAPHVPWWRSSVADTARWPSLWAPGTWSWGAAPLSLSDEER
jgi:hypothetical protein